MEKNIAYCGLDCDKCNAYIATINNDETLRKDTAELWSKLNNAEITPDMINCHGCRKDGIKTPFCENICQIRKCAVSKGCETCADCDSKHTCKILCTVTGNSPEAEERLNK